MARIGFFSMPWAGHLNPLCALAQELAERGHEVIFFHLPEFRTDIESRGAQFCAYGNDLYPPGTFARRNTELRKLKGEESAAHALETTRMCGEALLTEARPIVESANLDLWVVDHLDYAASILSRSMKARFVTVITTLMRHAENGIPGFSGEPHDDTSPPDGLSDLVQPWREALDHHSLEFGLGPFSYDTVWSELAQITQQPRAFEYPRRNLPDCFHFTGPFLSARARKSVSFPWEWLSGAPLLYASLGSVGQGNLPILQAVIDAVTELPVQVVVSAGEFEDKLTPQSNVLVRSYVPQLELLKKATLMIHHAGMNSTLECLSEGVPMVALPLASDQPGIARRIEWKGIGINLWGRDYSAENIRVAIEEVLNGPGYRKAAKELQRTIAVERGVEQAAKIIEWVASS